jgi:hypothetical protein
MPNQFGVASVDCVGGLMTVKYSDNGNCKVAVAESAGFGLDANLPVPNLVPTPLPGAWYTLFGNLEKVGLTRNGDVFTNTTGQEIYIKLSLQYGWRPFSTAGTSRLMFVKRNNVASDIVLANYAASNNTDVSQTATNVFVLKANEYFQPWAWQNSGALAYLGIGGLDSSTNIQVPETTLTIERIFDYR